jgi:hypothetical protein
VKPLGKIDYRKELKSLYNPSAKEAALVEVPQMNFIMIDGTGNPNTSGQYRDGVEALFAVSYTLKFMVKKGKSAVDYAVMPLEGLWWAEKMDDFALGNKDNWLWTSMIMQPQFVTQDHFEEALTQVQEKKNLPALPRLRFEPFQEGLAAQIMHIGPFANEKATVDKLYVAIKQNGYRLTGKHHEIYLNDVRKTAPEKLKTIIRQPIAKN